MADQTLAQARSAGSLGFNLGQMTGVIPSTAKLASSAGLGGVYKAASGLPSIGGALFGSAIPAGELAAAGTLGGIGPTTAAGAGGLFGGAGLGALGTALPYVGLGLGALALVSSFRKPTVGPNFNLRFSGTGGSQVIPRPDNAFGVDNDFSPADAQRYSQSFSERISDLLNRVGGTAVDNGLEGTIGYNRGFGGYFSQFDESDSTQTADDLDAALVNYLMGNIARGRIMADPDALRAAMAGGEQGMADTAADYAPTDWNDYRAWLSTLGDDGGSKGASSAAVLPQLAAMMQARQAPVDPFTAWAQEVQAMRGGGGGGAPAFSGGFGGFGGGIGPQSGYGGGIGPQSGYGGGDPDSYSGGGSFSGGDPDSYGGGGFSGGGFSGGDPDDYGG